MGPRSWLHLDLQQGQDDLGGLVSDLLSPTHLRHATTAAPIIR